MHAWFQMLVDQVQYDRIHLQYAIHGQYLQEINHDDAIAHSKQKELLPEAPKIMDNLSEYIVRVAVAEIWGLEL